MIKKEMNINKLKTSHMQFAKLKNIKGYGDVLDIIAGLYAHEVSAATSVPVKLILYVESSFS